MENFVQDLIDKFENCGSLDECYNFIDNQLETVQEFEELDLNLFKYKEFYFRTGKVFSLETIGNNLKSLNLLELSSAPEFVGAVVLKNNEDMVLITKILGSAEFELEKYMRAKSKLNQDSKKQLINDFDKLASTGIYNVAMVSNVYDWYVVAGRVYIDNWNELLTFENDEQKVNMRQSVVQACEL